MGDFLNNIDKFLTETFTELNYEWFFLGVLGLVTFIFLISLIGVNRSYIHKQNKGFANAIKHLKGLRGVEGCISSIDEYIQEKMSGLIATEWQTYMHFKSGRPSDYLTLDKSISFPKASSSIIRLNIFTAIFGILAVTLSASLASHYYLGLEEVLLNPDAIAPGVVYVGTLIWAVYGVLLLALLNFMMSKKYNNLENKFINFLKHLNAGVVGKVFIDEDDLEEEDEARRQHERLIAQEQRAEELLIKKQAREAKEREFEAEREEREHQKQLEKENKRNQAEQEREQARLAKEEHERVRHEQAEYERMRLEEAKRLEMHQRQQHELFNAQQQEKEAEQSLDKHQDCDCELCRPTTLKVTQIQEREQHTLESIHNNQNLKGENRGWNNFDEDEIEEQVVSDEARFEDPLEEEEVDNYNYNNMTDETFDRINQAANKLDLNNFNPTAQAPIRNRQKQQAASTEELVASIKKLTKSSESTSVSMQRMQQYADMLKEERTKVENKSPEQQRRLNEALGELVKAMTRYQAGK